MKDGWSPLHMAAQAGHLEVCQWLVTECGCDASVAADVSVDGIVGSCCELGGLHGIFLQHILRLMTVSLVEQNGRTPLHFASAEGWFKLCRWLTNECSCDVSTEDGVRDCWCLWLWASVALSAANCSCGMVI